jgi:hypothetical protein
MEVSLPAVSEPEIKILLYPNPLNNSGLNILIENLSSSAMLKVYSITGIELYAESIENSGITQINRSVFRSGVYIVKVYNENFVKSSKLIVN